MVNTTALEQDGAAVAELRDVFATGRTCHLSWRLAQLRGIERLCVEREQEIVDARVSATPTTSVASGRAVWVPITGDGDSRP